MKLSKRLVMIDDDASFLHQAKLAVTSSRCGIDVVCSGLAEPALQCLRAQADLRNLILVTDLVMPETTGFDVIKTVRADAQLCRVPILVLTYSVEQEDIIRCYRLGAQGFLTKPIGAKPLENMFTNLAGIWKFYAGEEEWLENARRGGS